MTVLSGCAAICVKLQGNLTRCRIANLDYGFTIPCTYLGSIGRRNVQLARVLITMDGRIQNVP